LLSASLVVLFSRDEQAMMGKIVTDDGPILCHRFAAVQVVFVTGNGPSSA